MDQTPMAPLDGAAFQRVWRRVMPQDRPDCPFTLEETEESGTLALPVEAQGMPLCLGEGSLGWLPGLESLLVETLEGERQYRVLTRRWQRQGLPAALAGEKRRLGKRLRAAWFLISGSDFTPAPLPAYRPRTLPLALRERFREEQRLALRFTAAAGGVGDACLVELYREGAEECKDAAERLRGWMERR